MGILKTQKTIDQAFIEWYEANKDENGKVSNENKDLYGTLVDLSKEHGFPIFHINTGWVENSEHRRTFSDFNRAIFNNYPAKTDEQFVKLVRDYLLRDRTCILLVQNFWGFESVGFYQGTKCLLNVN